VNIAVLTLTRDRLAYTQHCFEALRDNAGCYFDHYVLDQGSTDGTAEYLLSQWVDGPVVDLALFMPDNIGINRGMDYLLEYARDYDVIVKFDNDCELTMPNTLRDVAHLALGGNCLLSPRILGLNNPPASQGTFEIAGETILDIPQIGGIFIAAPARAYQGFQHDPTKLLDDDVDFCWWWRGTGGRCGYVERLTANHYETTSGQHARYPEYFARTLAEGKASL
jgi:GT2 family glycosyltransferase